MHRVAVLNSHPTPYTAPFFRRIAERGELDLTVLYCSAFGTAQDARPMKNFGRQVVWDVEPFGGYRHKLLWSPFPAHPQKRLSNLGLGLATELSRRRYDALVVYGWSYPVSWLAFALARLRGIPFLLYGDTNIRDPGTFLPGPLRRGVVSALLRLSAGALYTGTFNRDFYIRHGLPPDRLWFSPYAVDSGHFAAGDRAQARARLGLRDDTVYALFVGTLVERKRPLALLEAVSALQREGHRVGALFAGTGALEEPLARRVGELEATEIHRLGFVNQGELPDLYAAADVFVLPSAKDPRATVVNEAMAASRPVVVSMGTGVWGPGDLVQDGREGFVVPTDDQPALTAALGRLTDPDLRRAMGEAAAARARYWSFDRAAAGWAQAVRALAPRG